MSIFVSPEARDTLRAWYPRFHAKLGVPTEDRTVPTRFGDTHVLVAGPADGPPLLVLHGAMATSAHVLREVQPLTATYRVYAPDLIGHSPMSADDRPPLDGYAGWATDVLDGLGLDRVGLVAVSYGGFVGQRLMAAAPDRVSRASLVVPAGLVNGPAWAGLTRMGVPMLMYRTFPSEARLKTFVTPLFTRWDDDWAHWLGDAVRFFRTNLTVPPLSTREGMAAWRGPTQVFGADEDLSFPGDPLVARAREVFAQVEDTHVFRQCKHAPPFTDAFREDLCARIDGFLQGRAVAA